MKKLVCIAVVLALLCGCKGMVQEVQEGEAAEEAAVLPTEDEMFDLVLELDPTEFESLLAKGAPVNAVNADGVSLLEYAVLCGHWSKVELLLSHGADACIRFRRVQRNQNSIGLTTTGTPMYLAVVMIWLPSR